MKCPFSKTFQLKLLVHFHFNNVRVHKNFEPKYNKIKLPEQKRFLKRDILAGVRYNFKLYDQIWFLYSAVYHMELLLQTLQDWKLKQVLICLSLISKNIQFTINYFASFLSSTATQFKLTTSTFFLGITILFILSNTTFVLYIM